MFGERLPLQTCLHSASAAVVVQSRLHEPCSVYCFASFCARQKVSCWLVGWLEFNVPFQHKYRDEKVSCSFVPLLIPDPGDATAQDMPTSPTVSILKVTQQGAEPVRCGRRLECARWSAPWRHRRMQLNRPCAAAMRPYVKLLWPLVIMNVTCLAMLDGFLHVCID